MRIRIVSHTELLTQRTTLMLEAEALLAKIARLTTRYHTRLYKIRKKIQALETILGE